METTLASRRQGCIYGQAIGDALGIPGEYKTTSKLRREDFSSFRASTRPHETWAPGEWSDDTAQALILCETLIHSADEKEFLLSFARGLHDWLRTNGKGCGRLTRAVLTHPNFLTEPVIVAQEVWKTGGSVAAPNGGVMRAALGGLVHPEDLVWTEVRAAAACRATHYDPRCVASAVGVAVATACLVAGKAIDEAIAEAFTRAKRYHRDSGSFIGCSLSDLALDEGLPGKGAPVGYTYKCFGAGFWALEEANKGRNFTDILAEVCAAGGDADTNAAVAGALLGAHFGIEGIPEHFKLGLYKRDVLDRVCALLEGL